MRSISYVLLYCGRGRYIGQALARFIAPGESCTIAVMSPSDSRILQRSAASIPTVKQNVACFWRRCSCLGTGGDCHVCCRHLH